MQEEIGKMMPSRVHPEKRYIKHVRQPGQGMPVAGIRGSKCPDDPVFCEAILDLAVFSDVSGVIKADKFVVYNLPIDSKCRNNNKETDQDVTGSIAARYFSLNFLMFSFRCFHCKYPKARSFSCSSL